MARDEMARERDSEQTLLDRRSNLRLANAAAATVAGATETGNVAAQEGEDGSE